MEEDPVRAVDEKIDGFEGEGDMVAGDALDGVDDVEIGIPETIGTTGAIGTIGRLE